MGITTLDRDLGPALTLGGVDVRLLDMVYGYSTFANSGVMAGVPAVGGLPSGNRELDPMPVLKITNRRGDVIVDNTQPAFRYVIHPEYAWMISDILSKDENRQITYGRGSNLNIPGHQVAVKTGTSEPYEKSRLIGDTWTIGYTPEAAVGVWVGNTDNTPMVNILSTTIAGSTWHDVMRLALQGKAPQAFIRPEGLVQATVCVPSGRPPRPGERCPTVTGTFAAEALNRQDDSWWGGQKLLGPVSVSQGIPAEITGWKRYLAQEYQRSYRGAPIPRSAPPRASAPPPPPAQQQPAPPPPSDDGDNGRDGGNRRGSGSGNRSSDDND
jgi:membrane peptidoglycan carboxypeptidase